jgi:hypothetical protein
MPVASNQEVSWNLSDDRKTVRLDIPPLRLARIRQPIVVQICFDALAVDTILNRLAMLRAQMLPKLPAPRKLN